MNQTTKDLLKLLLIIVVVIIVIAGVAIIFQGETLKKTNRAQEYLIERYQQDSVASHNIIVSSQLREDSLLNELSILKAGINETQINTDEIIQRLNDQNFHKFKSIPSKHKLDTLAKYFAEVNAALRRLNTTIEEEHKRRQSIVHSE